MSKKMKNALNEKMQVKLPEALNKENILAELDVTETKAVKRLKKKNVAKKLVPMAASLLLVIGLVGMYFSLGLGEKNQPMDDGDITEVVRYQSYDKIYEKFDVLHKDLKKDNIQNGFEYFVDIFAQDNVATDMSATDDESAEDDALTGSEVLRPESTNGTSSANKQHGTTNTQEKGVDEGDIIKTDGNYLYIANADNKSISIVDITGKKMVESAQIDVAKNQTVQEIYINGDKLLVVGSRHKETEAQDDVYSINGEVVYKTYGCYSLVSSDTFVKVYDISDRSKPEIKTEYSQQGSYDNSRMIGTKLYAISTYFVDITADDYRDKCIPEMEVKGVCEKIPADCISVIEESKESTYAVITTIDISTDAEPSSEAVLGNCDELYASAKGLFLSETEYDNKTYEEFTKIYRFEYTDTGVNYKCMGNVAGYINDQFSMSYDGEYFRIATTLNKAKVDGDTVSMSTDNRVNNLYILNNNMQIVGKVEDMAKGETIQSVRFVGNMAYVVTFLQTDPLFVIDLSNPENPTVKGELKIPGFSEYLHPIADGLLVGVGQDGTESGTNGDCKVSLFDVTNPYEPKESSVLPVADGKGHCYTDVSHNHKLYINLSENEFAVPFAIHRYVNGGKENLGGDYYIRYRLTGDGLCEVNRYYIGNNDSTVMGATFVDDVFYVVTNNYGEGTFVTAFDLASNEQLGRLKTTDWRSN